MTAELTAAERRELPDQIGTLSERAAAKASEIERAERQIEELSDDVTAGKAGAKASALKLTAFVSEAAIERNAILNSMAKLEERWKGDAPFREALAVQKRREEARSRALKVLEASDEADAALRAFVAALKKRHDAAEGMRNFIDLTDQRTIPQVNAVMSTALAAAGIREFDSTFQASPAGCNSVAEHDAQVLGAVLPHDHPAVVSNRKRQDAMHAEYRRQNSEALPEPRRYHPPGL